MSKSESNWNIGGIIVGTGAIFVGAIFWIGDARISAATKDLSDKQIEHSVKILHNENAIKSQDQKLERIESKLDKLMELLIKK